MIIIVLVVVIGISIILFYFRREISLKIHQIKSELRRKRTEKKEREKLKFDIHIKELFLRANKKIMESDLFKQSFRYLEALDKLRTATSISNQIHAFLKKKNLKGYFSESYIQEKLAKLSKLENEIISLETNCRSHILQINNWIFQIEDMEKFPGLKVILKNVLRSAPMFEIEYFLKNRETYEKWGRAILSFKAKNNRFPTKKEIWEMGILIDRIEDVLQFLNLQITPEILPDLDDDERNYFDALSQQVIKYVMTRKLDALRLYELVLKLNLKIRDAKIVIPFINEVLKQNIKIEMRF